MHMHASLLRLQLQRTFPLREKFGIVLAEVVTVLLTERTSSPNTNVNFTRLWRRTRPRPIVTANEM